MTDLTVSRTTDNEPPILIAHPKTVDVELQGPVIFPVDQVGEQQPIWGRAVRLFHGAQDRFNPADKARVISKPGHRGEVVEPDGTCGSSYAAYLELVRACFSAGWTPDQTDALLDSSRRRGPGAQHRWQWARHSNTEDWFTQLIWNPLALSTTTPYYRRQVDVHLARASSNTVNKSSCPGGPITSKYSESPEKPAKPFTYSEERLAQLRAWIDAHPGEPQDVVKASGVMSPRAVTTYLHELERRGLITFSTVRTGRPGQPRKVWQVVPTADEIEAAERQAAILRGVEEMLLST